MANITSTKGHKVIMTGIYRTFIWKWNNATTQDKNEIVWYSNTQNKSWTNIKQTKSNKAPGPRLRIVLLEGIGHLKYLGSWKNNMVMDPDLVKITGDQQSKTKTATNRKNVNFPYKNASLITMPNLCFNMISTSWHIEDYSVFLGWTE